MAVTAATDTLNLGFLTFFNDANGYVGGFLVTNQWGRPLEFRLSTPVQPNRVQQILYGDTLEPYLCADLIGKTLLDKTAVSPHLLVTDKRSMLDLRWRVDAPVVWLTNDEIPEMIGRVRPASEDQPAVCRHPSFPADDAALRQLLQRLAGTVDLSEPFGRVREAMHEARIMGVANRG